MRFLPRFWSGAVLGVLLSAPGGAAGQVLGGVAVEQVSLAPVRGALVTLFRVDSLGDPVPAAVTTADAEGAFLLSLPGPGVYRAQAEVGGLASPLSPALELLPGDTLLDLELVVPSRLLMMAYECGAEAGGGAAVVVGVVRDEATDVVLPQARITARWQDGRVRRWGEALSDAAGRYRICGVSAAAGSVKLRGEMLGRQGEWEEVTVQGPSVVFHDIPMRLRARPTAGQQDVIRDRIQVEAAARALGDLSGEIHDQLSGAPLAHAVVRMEGTSHQALADAEGRFVFEGIQPGTYILEIWNLGYTVRSDSVQVPPGQDVFVGLRIASRAVELEGIEVTTRSAVEEITRLTPFRVDVAYGEVMAAEELSGARAFEILRRPSPDVRVREVSPERGPSWICVESNRRVQRLWDVPACEQVDVIVDGVRAPDAAIVLRDTPASEIESIEFLPALEAQQRYGTGGNTANGAVVIWTRGRGPYASPLRNRR